MRAQCIMTHQLIGDGRSQFGIQSTPDINGCQFCVFVLRIRSQLFAFTVQVGTLGIRL